MKTALLITTLLFMAGCSHFRINAAMCDQIASDPHATVPKECRNYNEDDAHKAFDNPKDSNKSDIIEFHKE